MIADFVHRSSCVSRALLVAALALVVLFSASAHGEDDDLPGRVARVADFAGELFAAPEDQADDWTAIGLNQPVTSGDNLWVAANGRAEIDYGGGQFRIAGGTSVHVSRLDDREVALFVAQGRLIVRVRALDPGNDVAYVDTPNTQVRLLRAGLYRIDVDPDAKTTTLVVREGEATVALASSEQQALAGQRVTVAGVGAADAEVGNGGGIDTFDAWSAGRDRRYERARSASYVSPQMVGYADLDGYGAWETSSTYGPVWYPAVALADWAPYRFGHWTWVRGFGYTWVDDAPWGYAPSHYGRWVHERGRWGWCPGQYVVRPQWAPALVAWYGGSGWSLSTSYGSPVYGWVPLAWGEPYMPWWGRCSHDCWVRFNRPYAVNVAERPRRPPAVHANLRVPGAITAVPGSALAGSRPVANNRVPIRGAAPPPALGVAPAIKPLMVGQPIVRPGTRGAPPPASALYQGSSRRGAPAPSTLVTPAPSASPASPFGTRQAAPAPPLAAPAAPSRAFTPTPSAAPRGQPGQMPPPRVAPAPPPAAIAPSAPVPRVVAPLPAPSSAPASATPRPRSTPLPPPSAVPAAPPAPRGAPPPPPSAVPAAPAPAPRVLAPLPAPRIAPPPPRIVPPPPSPPAAPQSAPAGQPPREHPGANPRGAAQPEQR